jgi:O-antigen ligase
MTKVKSNQTALLLSAMMVFVPALGFPNEELLQDTLKSILVAFFTLSATLVFFWQLRKQQQTLHFHALLGLPILLMSYALGSMVWSHGYLSGVEAVRWYIFSLIVFLGMNTLTPSRVTPLVWGIHLGAVIASLWTALQFWLDFSFFAQGPNPASTFVNRNFFGEFIVCTFPFSTLLLTRVKDKTSVFFLSFSLGFNIVALLMTGTRSALTGLLLLVFLLPIIIFVYRKQITSIGWSTGHYIALFALLTFTILSLGSIPTNNSKLLGELGPVNALDRALTRTLSLAKATEYSEGSFSIRAKMWKATGRMIKANLVLGVGAGAWEVHAPVFQDPGSMLETDYYAHNEILQVLAEYGLVGWLFLLSLLWYLSWAAYRTCSAKSELELQEAPLRALTLASLLALLLVSNAGFPWRMATTGAMFALSLSILAASDVRLGAGHFFLLYSTPWKPQLSRVALITTGLCSVLAIFIAQQAIECESKIVRAVKIAMTIQQSSQPNNTDWNIAKTEMLELVTQGVAINQHYRKLTPIVADALASWGDWKNATWIWESVLVSRPYVFALISNLARSCIQMGDYSKASEYLNRARDLQPNSTTLAMLEVILWSRVGMEPQAASRAKGLLDKNVIDPDLVRTAYYLGMRTRNPALAIQALELRIKAWPKQAIDGWMKLGQIYDVPEARDPKKALQSYQGAMDAASPEQKNAVLAMIPQIYHSKIK